jgi:hypothetical protein
MKISKKIRLAGLLVLTFAACFLLFSCRFGSKKVGEKIIENSIEKATGENAKVDLDKEKAVIETAAGRTEIDGNATTWPDAIPDDVPEFKFGKIDAVTSSTMDGTNSWTVAFKEVNEGFLEKYDAQLKEKGFETTIIKVGDKGGSIMAESDKYSVFLMGGEGTVSLAVTTKKQE